MTADSSPATNPSGASMTVTRWRSTFADLRSLSAALIVTTARDGMYMTTLSAETAAAATSRPSSTRCGARESSCASLRLKGSPSAPLPITTGYAPGDRRELASGGEAGAAAPSQPGAIEPGDQIRCCRFGQRAELPLVFGQPGAARCEQA